MSPSAVSRLGFRTAALLAGSGMVVFPLGSWVWLAARTDSSTQPTAAGTRLLTATGAQ